MRNLCFILPLLLLLSACQLAAPNGSVTDSWPIGFYLTQEPGEDVFFPRQGDLEGIPVGKNSRQYALVENVPYSDPHPFSDKEGLSFFYAPILHETGGYSWRSCIDGYAIQNVSLTLGGEDHSDVELEGTLYVSTKAGEYTWYLNPVYRDTDGRQIYLTPAEEPVRDTPLAGGGIGHTLEQTFWVEENGRTMTKHAKITCTIMGMDPVDRVTVTGMDGDHQPVSRTDFAVDDAPDRITPDPSAAYLVVESYDQDGGLMKREIVSREGQEKSDGLTVQVCQPEGYFLRHTIAVKWDG